MYSMEDTPWSIMIFAEDRKQTRIVSAISINRKHGGFFNLPRPFQDGEILDHLPS